MRRNEENGLAGWQIPATGYGFRVPATPYPLTKLAAGYRVFTTGILSDTGGNAGKSVKGAA